jgi:cobalamin biosynthesis protein CbiG
MAMLNRIAVYALTRPAAELAARLVEAWNTSRVPGDGARCPEPATGNGERGTQNRERGTGNPERKAALHLPDALAAELGGRGFSRLGDLLLETFHSYEGHVFLTATGIAVRGIAPLLRGKATDPAVVVLDQRGEYAVSLLSGHLGGGNRLAREVAGLLGGRAVITTATDSLGLPSIEELAREADMGLSDLRAATPVNAALANGRPLQLFDPQERLGLAEALDPGFPLRRVTAPEEIDPDHAAVWVDRHRAPEAAARGALVLHPRCLVAGIGCNRGTGSEEILGLLRAGLEELGLAEESLYCLVTTSAKRDEAGLLSAAEALGLPLDCLEAEELGSVAVPNPSETVSKHMGVASVCEAAALHRARTGNLLLTKRKSANATLALALAGSRP